MSDFSHFSEDEEWCEIVVDDENDDNNDDKTHPTIQQSSRPRRSTAKIVHYNEEDYGMINEYSKHTESTKQYTGKRGQYQRIDTIADLSNLSNSNNLSSIKKKANSSGEGNGNDTFKNKIDNMLDAWTKDCPIDFATLTALRNDAIRSQRKWNQDSTFNDKIIISCVYFGMLKYDYIRNYYQNYITISRAKECIKFSINRDPEVYASFDDVPYSENLCNFEEIVDFFDIEEVAISPTKGYTDQISGETIYFAALTLYHPLDSRYNGNCHFPLSVIACGNHQAFDSSVTEALYENSNEKYSKALQEWPSRYILLLFQSEKEIENFNIAMSSLLPDRIKPIYKSYIRQISNYLAAYHANHKKLFNQSHVQKQNYTVAKRVQSKRDKRRLSKQIVIDEVTHMYAVDPEDKVPYFSYPFNEDAKDVITIYKGDLKCLLSSNYLNDALIDFKIKLLINECPAEVRSMIHSFHCSFGKNLLDAISGREYQAVSNWTNKIELFKLKYIIVPMNKGMHWSVAIIVNPLNIVKSSADEVNDPHDLMDTSEDAPSNPNLQWRMVVHEDTTGQLGHQTYGNKDSFIIFMDSLNMHNYLDMGAKLNNYLLEEWKEKKHIGDLQPLRLIKCCVPRQQNGFDCGIFVIKYVTHFLQKCYEYESNTGDRHANEIYHETFAANSFDQEQATKEREDMLGLCHTMAKEWNEWKVANLKDSKTTDDDDYIEHVK